MYPKIVGFPPKSSNFNRVFHYKPSILGYPYFWKHPFIPPGKDRWRSPLPVVLVKDMAPCTNRHLLLGVLASHLLSLWCMWKKCCERQVKYVESTVNRRPRIKGLNDRNITRMLCENVSVKVNPPNLNFNVWQPQIDAKGMSTNVTIW